MGRRRARDRKRIKTMLLDAAFPALLAARLRRRLTEWTTIVAVAELDDHLRRDVGLPPRAAGPAVVRGDWR
jgi:hypothetical protein